MICSFLRERGHSKHSVIIEHFLICVVAVPFLLVRLLLAGLEYEMISLRFGSGVPDQGVMVIPVWVFFRISVIDGMDV